MPVELFADLGRPDAQLHPQYLTLRDSAHYAPARGQMRELQDRFDDPDGNFVEQFQTGGFDSRTFEFFLFAMLRESGHAIDRTRPRPDFLISRDGVTAAVESVIAAVPHNEGVQPYFALPPEQTPEERLSYVQQNVPIRLGSPLFSKLKQRYWLEPHVAGKPLVIAIQDFHGPGSLATSSSALSRYLFGFEQHWYHDSNGKLIIGEKSVEQHQVGTKKIPSGFFHQPDAEHISAVLFCNTGTAPKFARMGQQGAYRSEAVRMLRWGTCYKHDPNAVLPEGFVYEVGNPEDGLETWREGTCLIRNPNAAHPLPDEWFGAAVEEDDVDGKHVSTFREPFMPYWSMTKMFTGPGASLAIHAEALAIAQVLGERFPMLK